MVNNITSIMDVKPCEREVINKQQLLKRDRIKNRIHGEKKPHHSKLIIFIRIELGW